jgi:putative Mg2+ transporter-C (MgtC) family protein
VALDAIFQNPDAAAPGRIAVRLSLAALFGGALGWERGRLGKTAGLRTHMLVSLGSALFVVAPLEAGATANDITRVVQGIATGIGFIGAGTIIKLESQGLVKGLMTASSVWIAAAIGLTVGAGLLWVPLVGALLALLILEVLGRIEAQILHPHFHDTL